jgi:ankyrin repeat protein
MKALKIIIPAVVVIILVGALFLIRSPNRKQIGALRQMIYTGDARGLDEFLTRHPSLSNAKNIDTEEKGWTPLHMAAYVGNPEIIKVLLDHHAQTEARDNRGLTPLLWTAFVGKPDAAAALLSGGADINAKGRDGRTTLEQAKISLNQEMIALLRERGAKE